MLLYYECIAISHREVYLHMDYSRGQTEKILNNFSILNDTYMILESLESGFLGTFGDTKSIPIECWYHIKPKKNIAMTYFNN